MSPARGRILVVRGGAIGDFILTLPVLAALRRAFPKSRLTVLGYPHIAHLAVWGGLAEEVHSIESREFALFFSPKARPFLPDNARRFFAGFDLILSYLFDPDGFFAENVRHVSHAQFLAGPHRPKEESGVHACETFLKPLESLAIWDADPVPRLSPPPGAAAPPPEGPPLLAVHPGSGSPSKNWPEECWHELLSRLGQQTGWRLLLIGGEAERERCERLAGCWPASRLETALARPLTEVATRLLHADAFVGHDSGITHLAGALGRPGLVLWGPTNPEIWRPRHPALRLLQHPKGLAGLSPEFVQDQLTDLLSSQPGA